MFGDQRKRLSTQKLSTIVEGVSVNPSVRKNATNFVLRYEPLQTETDVMDGLHALCVCIGSPEYRLCEPLFANSVDLVRSTLDFVKSENKDRFKLLLSDSNATVHLKCCEFLFCARRKGNLHCGMCRRGNKAGNQKKLLQRSILHILNNDDAYLLTLAAFSTNAATKFVVGPAFVLRLNLINAA